MKISKTEFRCSSCKKSSGDIEHGGGSDPAPPKGWVVVNLNCRWNIQISLGEGGQYIQPFMANKDFQFCSIKCLSDFITLAAKMTSEEKKI